MQLGIFIDLSLPFIIIIKFYVSLSSKICN